ncbi:MAG: DUF6316 family protein [Gammaproteobacteria bacterium]|nr:DUF6316 family protein [Gammaproteobacteria bacterium]
MKKRKTDKDDVAHFRAGSRIFRLNNEWYFSSREGEHGPFESEEDAARELQAFVKLAGVADGSEPAYEMIEAPELRRADTKVWDKSDNLP